MQAGPLAQARQFAERGQTRNARRAFKQALATSPANAEILMEYGVLEAQAGEWKAARKLLDKASRLSPDDFDVRLNLAEVLRQSDGTIEAVPHYRKAVELEPNDVDALYGLGDALRVTGDFSEAIGYLDRAHQLAPQDGEVLNALAIALESDRQLGRAMQCYHRAITLMPNALEPRCNYGQILFNEGFYAPASQVFAGASKLSLPLPTRILLDWAVALSYEGDYGGAFEVVEQALAAGDAKVQSLFIKGVISMQMGRFDEAADIFHETLALDGTVGEAYERLARIKRLDPEVADRLRALLDDETLGVSPRAGAGFALYSVLDKAGDYEDAFDALARANALKSRELQFDADEHGRLISQTIKVFDADFFDARKGQGNQTDAPIFILGMPRSGTTLSEQILAAYDEVRARGERQDFQHLSATLAMYPDKVHELPSSWAHDQGTRILQAMQAGAEPARHVTNKSPGNYAFVGLIAWIFPNAKIIYCRRDPREIGLSCFEQNFRSGLSYAYDLEHFAFAYKQQNRIMEHWLEVSPINIHIVDYEQLVGNPGVIARGMVEYCGLEWDPQCLDTSKVTRPIETASAWQARQPINTGSLGKWKRYERQLQPMIEALGLE